MVRQPDCRPVKPAENWLERIRRARQRHALARTRKSIEAILSSDGCVDTADAERRFDELQNAFPPFDEASYGHDHFSVWDRGKRRASTLVDLLGRTNERRRILETGCADGMVGLLLSSYGHDVVLSDILDLRDPRSRSLPFLLGGMEAGLPSEGDRFDLVISYNTFEHVVNPILALRELLRLCRPAGLIYLDFGPLFAGPWGLHEYRMLHMPYPQFLFSEAFVSDALRGSGTTTSGQARTAAQWLNRWRLGQFDQLWASAPCRVERRETSVRHGYLSMIEMFPRSFLGRRLTFDDVTTTSVRVLIRKASPATPPAMPHATRDALTRMGCPGPGAGEGFQPNEQVIGRNWGPRG